MAKTNEVDALWPQFCASDQYKSIADIPAEYIEMCVQQFDMMMQTMYSSSLAQWNIVDVQQVLTMLGDTATSDSDPEAGETLRVTYDSIQMFIEFMVVNRKTNITRQEYNQLASNLAEIVADMPDDDSLDEDLFDTDPFDDDYYDDGLPQWQQYTADDISRYTAEWISAYVASPDWKKRPKGVTEDFLRTALDTLSEEGYNTYRKTPRSWSKKAIVGVFSGYFVSNVTLEPEEYALVAPALCALLGFVGQQGWLNGNKVSTYQRQITAAAPDMIKRAQDPNNYGTAKRTWRQMAAEDVDINDPQAVQQFMDKINAQGGLDSLHEGGNRLPNGLDLSADETEMALERPATLKLAAEGCDPDTQQDFLKQQHLPKSAGWQRATAIKVHQIGVQAGVRLWLTRQDYDLPTWMKTATDCIANAYDIGDLFYAQYGTIPAQWTTESWQEFGAWSKEGQAAYQENGHFFAIVMQMLVANDDLDAKQAKACADAFFGKVAKRETGNVISMKDARKLLKKKKHKK